MKCFKGQIKADKTIVDYSKTTLCPHLDYKCYCQVGGKCEYCPYYHTNENESCEGCGANFGTKCNPKEKFINT